MKTKNNINRGQRSIIAVMCLATVTIPSAQAAEPYALGLKPPTEEEIQWMETNVPKLQAVQFNTLAIQRINAHRRSRGVSAVGLPAVEHGSESILVNPERAAAVDTATVASALPAAVDNSTLPCFPPIDSQGGIGSCVAWASTYYMGTDRKSVV